MSLETELHKALRDGRSHEIHRLTQLLGGRGVGVRKRLFFHLPGSRPEKEEMRTHVTMPDAEGRVDAQVFHFWSTPAELFLMSASPSYLSEGPRRLEGIGVEENHERSKEVHTREVGVGLGPGPRNEHSTHRAARTTPTAS